MTPKSFEREPSSTSPVNGEANPRFISSRTAAAHERMPVMLSTEDQFETWAVGFAAAYSYEIQQRSGSSARFITSVHAFSAL